MGLTALFVMPPYSVLDLVLIALAVLYIGHVITLTEGPGHAFRWLRDHTRRSLKGMLDCIWCVVFWAALALFFLHQYAPGITWIFAIAGAAMALRSYTGTAHG